MELLSFIITPVCLAEEQQPDRFLLTKLCFSFSALFISFVNTFAQIIANNQLIPFKADGSKSHS